MCCRPYGRCCCRRRRNRAVRCVSSPGALRHRLHAARGVGSGGCGSQSVGRWCCGRCSMGAAWSHITSGGSFATRGSRRSSHACGTSEAITREQVLQTNCELTDEEVNEGGEREPAGRPAALPLPAKTIDQGGFDHKSRSLWKPASSRCSIGFART